MSEQPSNPQLPPTRAIELDRSLRATTQEEWFIYPVRVYPHQTDYGGVVWHGSYLTWLEEARIEYLRDRGINFADLVSLGCDLPVIEISLRYHRSVRLGQEIIVKTRMREIDGVRINFDYQLISPESQELYLSGEVSLVPIDREKGKIMRQLPAAVKKALLNES